MNGESPAAEARRRVDLGLDALRAGLAPYVKKHMHARFGGDWRQYAAGTGAQYAAGTGALDVQALLKTVLANWNDLFRDIEGMRKARSFIFLSLDARNAAAHFAGDMEAHEALRYLDAMREVSAAADAPGDALAALYEEQRAAGGEPRPHVGPRLAEQEPPPPARLRPWREVCEPHPDVLEARFTDAEFAANLA